MPTDSDDEFRKTQDEDTDEAKETYDEYWNRKNSEAEEQYE